MDDFSESGFTELNFESALESILGHVDRTKSDPPLSQYQSVVETAGTPTPSPQTSTHESSVSCPSCAKYKTDLERLDKEYRVNFQFLKKKIINTDLLIRRFKTKQDSELHKKTIENLGQKLDQAKRDSSILSDQLKSTVESIKPLQERGTDLESALRKKSLEISDLHTLLAAEKAFGNQKAALDEETRNLQETVNSMKKEVCSLKNKKQKWEARANELDGMLDVLKGENKTGKTKINILAKALYQAQAVINKQWEILLANGLKVGKGPNVIPTKCKSLIRAAMGAQSLDSFSSLTGKCDNESDDPDFSQGLSKGGMNYDILEFDDTDDGDHHEDSIGKFKSTKTKEVKTTIMGVVHNRKSESTTQEERDNISSPEMNSPNFSGISDLNFSDDSSEEKSKDQKMSSFASGVVQNNSNQQSQAQEDIENNTLDSAGGEKFRQGNSELSPAATSASNVKSHVSILSKSNLITQKNVDAENNDPEPVHLPKTAEGQERSVIHSVKVEAFGNSDLELSDDEADDVRTIDKCSSTSDNVDSKRKRRKKKASPATKSSTSGSSGASDMELSDGKAECSKLDKTVNRRKNRGISEKFKRNEIKSYKKDTKKTNLLKQKISPTKKEWKTISSIDISESSDLELSSKEKVPRDSKHGLFGRHENRAVQNETITTLSTGTTLNPCINKSMNNFLANSDQNISHLSDSEEEEDSNDLEMPFKFLSEVVDEGQSLAKAKDPTLQSGVGTYKKKDLSSLLSFSMIENVLSPLASSPCPSAMSDTQNDDGNVLMPFSLSDSSDLESVAGTELASNQSILKPNNPEVEQTVSVRGSSDNKFNEDIIMEETASFNFCERDDSVCDKSSSQSDTLSSSTVTEGSSHTSTEGSSVTSSNESSLIQEQSGKFSTEIIERTPELIHICYKTPNTSALTDSSVNTQELTYSFDKTPESTPVCDKAKELTHVSEKTEELISVSDSTLEVAQVSVKTQEFTHVSDKTEVLTHFSKQREQLITISDKTLVLGSASDKTLESNHGSDEPPELTKVSEKTPELSRASGNTPELIIAKISEMTPELSRASEKTLEVTKASEKTPELITAKGSEMSPELTRVSESIPELTPVSEKTPELSGASGKTPELITAKGSENTPELTPVSEKTPELSGASEKIQELTKASEMIQEVTKASEMIPEVTKASEMIQEVTKASEKTPELTRASEKTPELTPVSEKTPELTKASENTQELTRALEKMPELILMSAKNSEIPQIVDKTPELTQASDKTPQLSKVCNTTLEMTGVRNTNPELTPDVFCLTTKQGTKESQPSALNKTGTEIFVPQPEISELVTVTSEKDSIANETLSSQNEETVSSLNSRAKATSKVCLPQLEDDSQSCNDHALVASKSIPLQGLSFPWPLQTQAFTIAHGSEMESKMPSSYMGDKQEKLLANSSNLENRIPSYQLGPTNVSRIVEKMSPPRLEKKVEMSFDISEKSVSKISSTRQENCEPIVHVANKTLRQDDSKLGSEVDTGTHVPQQKEKHITVDKCSKARAGISTSDVQDRHESKSNSNDPIDRPCLSELGKTGDSDNKFPRSQAKLCLSKHRETNTRAQFVSKMVGSEVPKHSKRSPTSTSKAITPKSMEVIEDLECKPRLVFDGSLSIEELAIELKALVKATVYEGDRTPKSIDYQNSQKGTQKHVQALRGENVKNKELDESFSLTDDDKIHESIQKNSDQFDFNSENAKVYSRVPEDFPHDIREDHSLIVVTRQTEEDKIALETDYVEDHCELMISDSFNDFPLEINEDISSEILSSRTLEKTNDNEAVTKISLCPHTDTDSIKQKSTDLTASDSVASTLYSSITRKSMDKDNLQDEVHSAGQNKKSSYAAVIKQSSQKFCLHTCGNKLPGDVLASEEEIVQLKNCLSEGDIPDSTEDSSVECVYADGKNFWQLLVEMEDFYKVPMLISPISPSLVDSWGNTARTTKTLKSSSRKRVSPDKDEVAPSVAVKKRLSKLPYSDSQKVKRKGDGTAAMKAKLRRKSTVKEESAAMKKVKLIPFTGFGSVLEAVKCDLRHYLASDSSNVDKTKKEMCRRGKDGSALTVWPDVITAVVLQLKSAEEDVLNQMLMAGDGERPPAKVFISGLENSLLGLLLSFIQHEKDIAVKDLMEALWNAIFDRASLQQCARLSLCRMFSRLCKEQNDEGQLKNLLFNIAWCGYLDFPRCFMSAIGVWPFLATFRSEDAASSAICLVFEFIFKQLKGKNAKLFSQISCILETCCRWKMSSPNIPADELLKNLVGSLQGNGQECSPEGFEIMKGIELLLFHMGSAWTQEHFLQRLCVSTVSSWCHSQGKVTTGRVTALFKIIGAVLAGNSSISETTVKILLGQVFSKAIEKKSRIKELEMALGEALMAVPRFVSQRCLDLLASWEEHNKDIIPNQVLARLIQFRCAFNQNPKSKQKKKKKSKNKKGR